NAGANGRVYGGVMQENEQLIVVGGFTTFNGQPANRIVRLNADGTIDASFAVGTGANDDITGIQYNTQAGKIIIFGQFSTFNGVPAKGLAVLDENGNVDPSFQFHVNGEGTVWTAHILNSGKIIVSHSYEEY